MLAIDELSTNMQHETMKAKRAKTKCARRGTKKRDSESTTRKKEEEDKQRSAFCLVLWEICIVLHTA